MCVKSLNFQYLQFMGKNVFNTVQAKRIMSRGQIQLLDHQSAISETGKGPLGFCAVGKAMSQRKPTAPVNKPPSAPRGG